MSGQDCLGWSYQHASNREEPDNSNTQYAMLGLHAGQQAGARIDRAVWQSIRDMYIRMQTPDGGWYYSRRSPSRAPTMTMTTAGLCGLIISGMELNQGREKIQANGQALDCGVYAENRPIELALNWLANRFSIMPRGDAIFYNLYGIERADD